MKTKTPKKTPEQIVKTLHLMHETTGIHPRRATDDELRHYNLVRKEVTEETILQWGKEITHFRQVFVPGAVFSKDKITLLDGTIYKYSAGSKYAYPPIKIINGKPKPPIAPTATNVARQTAANVDYGANGGTTTAPKHTQPAIAPYRTPTAPQTAPARTDTTHVGAKAAKARFSLCGFGVSHVLRWMGFNYWSPEQAKSVLRQYPELRAVSESTIATQLRDGRNQADGKKMSHGPVPDLNDKQIEELYSKLPAQEKKCPKNVSATGKPVKSSKVERTIVPHRTDKPSKKKGSAKPSRTVLAVKKSGKKKGKSKR